MEIYHIESGRYAGRFIIAQHSLGQYIASMTPASKRATGCHSVFGPSLANLAASGNVTTYASRGGARRAFKRQQWSDE